MISHSTVAATFAGLVLIGLSAGPGLAAQSPGRSSTTQLAEASPTPVTAAVESEEESANCNTHRRRLWIEGEGWMVRRVTVCR